MTACRLCSVAIDEETFLDDLARNPDYLIGELREPFTVLVGSSQVFQPDPHTNDIAILKSENVAGGVCRDRSGHDACPSCKLDGITNIETLHVLHPTPRTSRQTLQRHRCGDD